MKDLQKLNHLGITMGDRTSISFCPILIRFTVEFFFFVVEFLSTYSLLCFYILIYLFFYDFIVFLSGPVVKKHWTCWPKHFVWHGTVSLSLSKFFFFIIDSLNRRWRQYSFRHSKERILKKKSNLLSTKLKEIKPKVELNH